MRKRRYAWFILLFSFFNCEQPIKYKSDVKIVYVFKDAGSNSGSKAETVNIDTQAGNVDTINDVAEMVYSNSDTLADSLFEVIDIAVIDFIAPIDVKKEIVQLSYLDECSNDDDCKPIYAGISYCVQSENPEITGYKSLCTVPCKIKNGKETISLPVYGDVGSSCIEQMENGAVCCGLVENPADSNFHNYCIPSQYCCYNGIICGKECCKENITKCAGNGTKCIGGDEVECSDGVICKKDLCTACGCLQEGDDCCDDESLCFDSKCSNCGCLVEEEFCCNGKICDKDQCLACGCLAFDEDCCNGKICASGFKCTNCGCILNEKSCCFDGEICEDGFECSDCGCKLKGMICCDDGNVCENCSDCGCLDIQNGETCCPDGKICPKGTFCEKFKENYLCFDEFLENCNDIDICLHDYDYDYDEECSNCGCLETNETCCLNKKICAKSIPAISQYNNEKTYCTDCGCIDWTDVCCNGIICPDNASVCTDCGCIGFFKQCCLSGIVCDKYDEICHETKKICVPKPQCDELKPTQCKYTCCLEDQVCNKDGDGCEQKCKAPYSLYCENECCDPSYHECVCEDQGGFCKPQAKKMCDCATKTACDEDCIIDPICRFEGKFCKSWGAEDCPGEKEKCYCNPGEICTGSEPACCPEAKPVPCGDYCCFSGSECIPEIKACLKQDEEYCADKNPDCKIICPQGQKCMEWQCGCINDWEIDYEDGTICTNTQVYVGADKGLSNSGCCHAAQPVPCDGYCCNDGYHCDAACGCVEDGYYCCADGVNVCPEGKICWSGGSGVCLDSQNQDCGSYYCPNGSDTKCASSPNFKCANMDYAQIGCVPYNFPKECGSQCCKEYETCYEANQGGLCVDEPGGEEYCGNVTCGSKVCPAGQGCCVKDYSGMNNGQFYGICMPEGSKCYNYDNVEWWAQLAWRPVCFCPSGYFPCGKYCVPNYTYCCGFMFLATGNYCLEESCDTEYDLTTTCCKPIPGTNKCEKYNAISGKDSGANNKCIDSATCEVVNLGIL